MDIKKLQNLHCIARYVQNMAMNIKTELDLVLRKCKLLTIYYEVFWNVDTGKPHVFNTAHQEITNTSYNSIFAVLYV
jgi:hypothetical protein